MKQKIFALTAILILLFSYAFSASAFEVYRNYTYSNSQKAQEEPQAYYPLKAITGKFAGTIDFNNPNDMFVFEKNEIFIVDSGNNRIVVLDKEFKVIKTINTFINNGTEDYFKNPQGIFVTKAKNIYIADTENKRILKFDSAWNLLKVYGKPNISSKEEGAEYFPKKIAVDDAMRIYVLYQNINKGMVLLDDKGDFISYFGAIQVTPNVADLFWKSIATREQLAGMTKTIPTEYSNLSVDKDGFVYGTVSANVQNGTINTSVFVRKLNPSGYDILRRLGFDPPMGDVDYVYKDKIPVSSQFTDICVMDYGIYSALDKQKGRIFTYDNDGNLLFVFGGLGEKLGTFGKPEAIDKIESNFLILDSKYNQFVVFAPTDYSALITEASIYQYNREYIKAEEKWAQVLKYTSKSDLAYVRMGQSLLRQGKYEEAMKFFKLGNEKTLYSKAYVQLRNRMITKYFPAAVSAVILLLLFITIYGFVKKNYKKLKGIFTR